MEDDNHLELERQIGGDVQVTLFIRYPAVYLTWVGPNDDQSPGRALGIIWTAYGDVSQGMLIL